MRKIEIFGGNIDSCWKELVETAKLCGEDLIIDFNDSYIKSTDTLDDAYLRIIGKTKAQFDEDGRQWREAYRKRKEEFKAKIPELTDKYRKAARGLILKKTYNEWDNIVPIRLGDIYHGLELENVLELCKIMRKRFVRKEKKLRIAYWSFEDQGHSGCSASLVMSMLRHFCPDGNELADALKEFRYKNEERIK